MIRKRFVFNGRVQGVGFRYLTRRAADLIGVTGWVRNERDGSVTLEIQGTEEQVDGVMLALKHMIIKRGRYVRIESIDEEEVPLVADETGFKTSFL
jgi:acylphosphatase